MAVATEIRQSYDDGSPRPATIVACCVVRWSYDAGTDENVRISLPYVDIDDAERVLQAAQRIMPRWELGIATVNVAAAMDHESAVEMFRRFGW